jgi:hypothetical protein
MFEQCREDTRRRARPFGDAAPSPVTTPPPAGAALPAFTPGPGAGPSPWAGMFEGGDWRLAEGKTGPESSVSVAPVKGGLGAWRDAEGVRNQGAMIDVAALGAEKPIPRDGTLGLGYDANVGHFGAGVRRDASTTEAGFGASAFDAALSVGNREHSARFGVGAGPGLGGRVHHGDADGDGLKEYGFGLDVGPVSFDVRSEVFHHIGRWFKELFS